MKLIVAGCRHFNCWHADAPLVSKAIYESTWLDEITEIVSGGAKGIDTFAVQWAKFMQIPHKEFLANWTQHGKAAGPIRNREMATYADRLIAIWDGKSRGTSNMVEEMKKLNKPVFVLMKD